MKQTFLYSQEVILTSQALSLFHCGEVRKDCTPYCCFFGENLFLSEWKSVFSQCKLPHCQLRCELGKTLHCPKDNLIGKARHCGLVLESCRRDLLWPCFPTGKGISLNFTHFVYSASGRLMLKGLIVRDRHAEKGCFALSLPASQPLFLLLPIGGRNCCPITFPLKERRFARAS